MIFQVRRYKGPDKPQNGCEAVEAESRSGSGRESVW